MNKLKKVGLTALATTLVASSAYAGEMSVSGSASLNYSGLNTASGQPWSMGNSIVFSGGGDLDNGMTVGVSFELDHGFNTFDDYSLSLGLGDGLGTLGFSGASTSPGGIDSVKDIIPTAYTPVYENTDSVDNGLATTSGRNQTAMWGYKNTIGDVAISIGYNSINSTASADGSETSIGITYTTPIEGLTVVAGRYDDEKVADATTYGAKYTMGPLTAAYQITDVEYDSTMVGDHEAHSAGVSLAINENFSVSAGSHTVQIGGQANEEKNTGVSASYTVGSITIAGALNQVDNITGGSSNAEVSSLNIAFAF